MTYLFEYDVNFESSIPTACAGEISALYQLVVTSFSLTKVVGGTKLFVDFGGMFPRVWEPRQLPPTNPPCVCWW